MASLTKIQELAHSALFKLVERDHGGCEEEDCSLRHAIETCEDEAIRQWAMSGAACNRFNRIMDRFLAVKVPNA